MTRYPFVGIAWAACDSFLSEYVCVHRSSSSRCGWCDARTKGCINVSHFLLPFFRGVLLIIISNMHNMQCTGHRVHTHTDIWIMNFINLLSSCPLRLVFGGNCGPFSIVVVVLVRSRRRLLWNFDWIIFGAKQNFSEGPSPSSRVITRDSQLSSYQVHGCLFLALLRGIDSRLLSLFGHWAIAVKAIDWMEDGTHLDARVSGNFLLINWNWWHSRWVRIVYASTVHFRRYGSVSRVIES